MRKLFAALFLFITTVTMAMAGTVQITGTISSPSGAAFTGSIKFQLPVAGAVDNDCPGTCMVTPTILTIPINNGVLPSFARLTRNSDITPSNTYYRAFIYDVYGNNISAYNFVIPSTATTTFDLGSALQTTITSQSISYITPANLNEDNIFIGFNTFSQPTDFSEIGTPFTGIAGVDRCGGDNIVHTLKCSYNGGTSMRMMQVVSATLTTTAATTNTVAVVGMTATGHCSLVPTNAAASAGIASVFISNKTTDQITVTHTATAGWTFDVICTPQ